MPSPPESPDSASKLVRWGDQGAIPASPDLLHRRVEIDFGRLKFDECIKHSQQQEMACSALTNSSKVKTLTTEILQLERKIQKAAKVELGYLKEVDKVSGKLESFKIAQNKAKQRLLQLPTNGSVEEKQHLKIQVARIEQKIQKAIRMEYAYLKKAKDIRGKRYRWTKLYELKFGELEPLKKMRRRQLPPLVSSRKRVGTTW